MSENIGYVTMDDGDDRKKKKKSKKEKDRLFRDVNKTVSNAMKQVEDAMKQVKMATSKTKESKDDGTFKVVTENPDAKVIKVSGKTTIHVQNSKNVQVGNNNVMVINQAVAPRRQRHFSDEEDKKPNEPAQPAIMNETVEQEIQAVLASEREVTERDITIAVRHMGKSWRRVARGLGHTDRDTEILYADHGNQGIQEVAYQCLLLWKQRNGPGATVGKLANAVKKVEGSLTCLQELTP